jgi:hypothetical protein
MQKTTTDEPSAAEPQPNRAKRMECAQLAAAFVSAPEFDRSDAATVCCSVFSPSFAASPFGCGSAALCSSVIELKRAGHRNNFKHFVK